MASKHCLYHQACTLADCNDDFHRNDMRKSRRAYLNLGQFDYGVESVEGIRENTISIPNDNTVCLYVGQLKEGTRIRHGLSI
eukprot:CAMPEP_0168345852 /NCGR_PEP_ID=MMETSP0213-20121227/17847_1 /TAXON_ID=151035 /ORGANISM="Euplotes harpa, Strain FSP1.4" /LENGTH=81 /DNA_ID=CAMNT_0008354241 /DNA_START=135 /DNA_END=380 /DNA_ORIENTATION=+